MKKFLLLLLVFCSTSAFSQEAAKPPADLPKDQKERIALATEFNKVRPLKRQIDATLESLAQELTPPKREEYLNDMHRLLKYKDLETASIRYMAETFTPAELKFMVDYYSNPLSKTVEAKMPGYEGKLTAELKKALDAALVEMRYPAKK